MDKADKIIKENEEKVKKSIENLNKDFSKIRTGRATTALVDDIRADVYGQPMPLNQLANISIPEARQILIDVWDKSNVQLIEKALQTSGRNLNPQTVGTAIRIILPELTQETRKETLKVAAQKLEDYKVSVRNIRKDTNESLKKLKAEGLSEDDIFSYQAKVQKTTDDTIAKMTEIFKSKEKEVMTI